MNRGRITFYCMLALVAGMLLVKGYQAARPFLIDLCNAGLGGCG